MAHFFAFCIKNCLNSCGFRLSVGLQFSEFFSKIVAFKAKVIFVKYRKHACMCDGILKNFFGAKRKRDEVALDVQWTSV